jgi:hypothetical protein
MKYQIVFVNNRSISFESDEDFDFALRNDTSPVKPFGKGKMKDTWINLDNVLFMEKEKEE